MKTNIKKNQVKFEPYRLSQARLSKGWSQIDLARQLNLTRQAIYAFEKGDVNPSYETLIKLSKSLNVKESFFFLPFNQDVLNKKSAINFRSLKTSLARNRELAKTNIELFAELCNFLQNDYIDFPKIKLPDFNIADFEKLTFDEIEDFASKTRSYFGLKGGPISNLTLLLENHGVHVAYTPLPEKIEGLSVWYNDKPYILVNSNAYACRARLDLAHELGHLLLHRSLSEEELQQKEILDLVEKQAFYFGAAFLVPERTLGQEFYSADLVALEGLKKRWGLSISEFIRRLGDLDMISDNQKKYLMFKMRESGIWKKEPLDDVMPIERSITIKRVIELLNSNKILSGKEYLEKFSFPGGIEKLFANLPDEFFNEEPQYNNVIKLRA